MTPHPSEILKSSLFPPRCVICNIATNNEKYEAICDSCIRGYTPLSGFSCPECGKRIPTLHSICHRTNFLLCASQLYSNRPTEILIQHLKFLYIRSAAIPVAHMMLQTLNSVIQEIPFDLSKTLLTPIPLASRRERERGFNQSALLAKEIHSCIPQLIYAPKILKRIKYELPQTKTHTQKERNINLNNAFSADIPTTIQGLPIILIDDVYTTGATIKNAVKKLKEKGAGKIIVLVGART
ncbi:MAG: phosphoribosyl transferase [Parcubacteria group bacterium LiPW_41]|nr:MAG: phosphoribosyl transferase [Parcubacteria group bacterium LiPW_41]